MNLYVDQSEAGSASLEQLDKDPVKDAMQARSRCCEEQQGKMVEQYVFQIIGLSASRNRAYICRLPNLNTVTPRTHNGARCWSLFITP